MPQNKPNSYWQPPEPEPKYQHLGQQEEMDLGRYLDTMQSEQDKSAAAQRETDAAAAQKAAADQLAVLHAPAAAMPQTTQPDMGALDAAARQQGMPVNAPQASIPTARYPDVNEDELAALNAYSRR